MTVEQERDRNLEWALKAMICLAKRCLKDTNESRENENDWPAGQAWNGLGNTSKHSFMRMAREECGVPHEEWKAAIKKAILEDGQDLDVIWSDLNR